MPIRDAPPAGPATLTPATIPCGSARLPGSLRMPARARAAVVFAHGTCSGHASPRNLVVSDALNAHGIATLLFDLLTEEESVDRRNAFDVPLLADRLLAGFGWLGARHATQGLPLGAFGGSAGAAAALVAAAQESSVRAVVSRGGRPDLAGEWLPRVNAPTLLIVGSLDTTVLELNRDALRAMRGDHRLRIIPGATHLFGEPGALEGVAQMTCDWFLEHLLPVAVR